MFNLLGSLSLSYQDFHFLGGELPFSSLADSFQHGRNQVSRPVMP